MSPAKKRAKADAKDLTPARCLAALPPEQRAALKEVRDVVRRNLPKGYKEIGAWGMIAWSIPLSRYSDTYNKQPLCLAGLAARKNMYTLYLMGAYADPAQKKMLTDGFAKAGKTLDMGKSCIHFRRVEDLPLDVIGRVIRAIPVGKYIKMYETARARPRA